MSSMVYSYFPGGYFDADGAPHFLHTDYQGSVVMVTDSAGRVEQHTAYYPYGEPHREPAGQPILYAGKERLRTTADYNFDARRFCASMILMTAPDPSASAFHELSPYVYCGANPIRNIDITGREFTEDSWKFVNKLLTATDEIIDGFDKSILEKRTALNDESLSAKKRTKLLRGIEKLNNKKAMYQAVKDEINVLASSTQLYDIRSDDSRNIQSDIIATIGGSINSTIGFNLDTKIVEIGLGDESLGHISHELKHAYQFETGEFSLINRIDGSPFYDITDELDAYERGHLFGQRITFSIYRQYPNLQSEKKSAGTAIPIQFHSVPRVFQKISNVTNSIFRFQGVTYIPEK